MKAVIFSIVISIAIVLFVPVRINAEPVIIDPELNELPLGSYLEIFEDKTGRLKFEDILSKERSGSFIHSELKYPGFGYTESVYWVKFRVINESDIDREWVLEISYPHIDKINIFVLSDNDTIDEKRIAGDHLEFSKREFEHRNFVFKFKEMAGRDRTFYIRFETEGLMNIFLTMMSAKGFTEINNREQIMLGLYYGAIFVMLLYNLFLFFSVRDKSYLFYVLYYLFLSIFQLSMNGLAYQYLWPDAVWWANNSIPLILMLSIGFAVQFSRVFLNIPRFLPKIDGILKTVLSVIIVVLPFSLFADYKFILYISMIITIFSAVILTVSSIKILTIGFIPARFYVIAWTAFWTGTVLYALRSFSIIPNNAVTGWGYQAASLMEVVLISLGLADRINYMKRELEKLNVNLESVVDERTKKLNVALREMEKKDEIVQMEFELAGNIQKGILPQTPYYFEGIKIDTYYKSMLKVGGDFFDIFHMKGGYLGIIIADASGHGMPAAFITALAKITISEAVQTSLFPADIFVQVNNELLKTIKTDDFVTAFLVVISPSFEVFYGNASHQKSLVLRKDDHRIDEWDTNGLFMGSLELANDMYEDCRDVLNYGDRLLMYTDGFVESRNSDDELFGTERLKKIFFETSDLPIEDVKERIVSAWEDFIKDTEQTDDTTLVIVEIDCAYKDLIEYRDKGFKLLFEKKYSEAIKNLNRALEINPDDEKSQLFIGECYLKEGEYSKSVEFLKQYLVNNEVDANVYCHLAEAYYELDEYESAYKTAHKSTQLRNDFVDAMKICGLSLIGMGRLDEAKDVWRKILAVDPENKIALEELEKL